MENPNKPPQDIRTTVREHYGQIAESFQPASSSGCGCAPQSSACCTPDGSAQLINLEQTLSLYQATEVADLPVEVTGLSLGCGDPITLASLQPGQSVLDLGSGGGIDCFLAGQLQTLFTQLTQAVNYLLYLAMLAAFTVLFAAVKSSLDQRIHESALLRTFGATRHFLRKMQAIEFFCLGAISGIVGVLVAELLNYALYRQVMHIPFQPHPGLWLSVPLLNATVIAWLGLRGMRRVINSPPLRVLSEL